MQIALHLRVHWDTFLCVNSCDTCVCVYVNLSTCIVTKWYETKPCCSWCFCSLQPNWTWHCRDSGSLIRRKSIMISIDLHQCCSHCCYLSSIVLFQSKIFYSTFFIYLLFWFIGDIFHFVQMNWCSFHFCENTYLFKRVLEIFYTHEKRACQIVKVEYTHWRFILVYFIM